MKPSVRLPEPGRRWAWCVRGAIAAALAIGGVACILGPKQDDPTPGDIAREDSGGGFSADSGSIGDAGPASPDTSLADSPGTGVDDCLGDGGHADGAHDGDACVSDAGADAGDADADASDARDGEVDGADVAVGD